MADIQGTNNDDIIKGGRGDDLIEGLDGDDRITDVWGDNTINGGAGNDRILASRGEDVIDGGSGSDRIWTRHGDDVATYRLSENFGAEDRYDGGHGTDTLRLVLTAEEAQDAAILETIEALRSFVDDADPKSSGQPPTTFTFSIGGVDATLILRNFEKLEVVVEEPLPSLSIDDPTVTEGDPGETTQITFTITRSGDTSVASSVGYEVTPGSATTPEDYAPPEALMGTKAFAAGETEQTITLTITNDLIPENTETFTVTLSNPSNATIVKDTGTGTILDPDQLPAPELSIDDPTVTEGDPGETTLITFTITRSGDTSVASSVGYEVTPGSATTPEDYAPPEALMGTKAFAAGETEQTITLTITNDLIPENTETFTVTLSNPSNATIVKDTGTGTILDPDQLPAPELSIDDPTVTEGDPGETTLITFTITRSGDTSVASSVGYEVTPGSATTPEDYAPPEALMGTKAFAAGETEQTITLTITNDLIPENTETFTVTLSNPSNATIVKDTGTGTILDPDQLPAPELSIDDPTVTEGDPGETTLITFTITRSGDTSVASSVGYEVTPGSATTPEDYAPPEALMGTKAFAAGETEQTITLTITNDLIPENTETFTVTLSNPSNATIVKDTGTGTILDPDQLPAPELSIDDPTVTEGDPGETTLITFTITRSGDTSVASSVGYEVTPGSATTPEDYAPPEALMGTKAFAAGETEQTITLTITNDLIPENTETFTVALSNPSNATIVKDTGTGTILDPDQLPAPELSIDDPTVTEGDPGETTLITFTITRSGDTSVASSVGYEVTPGSATTPEDYAPPEALMGTKAFAAGETEQTITLTITNDLIPENTETFTVTLSNPSNATIVKDTGTGTILDEDVVPNPPVVSIDDITLLERGETADQFELTLSQMASEDVAVDWTVSDQSATHLFDYTGPLSGTTVVQAGSMVALLDLTPFVAIDDAVFFEGNETFEVNLTSVTGASAVVGDAQGIGTIIDNDIAPPLTDVTCGYTWGDPHYVTLDGLAYDFQAVGEFTLVEHVTGDPINIQSRTSYFGHNLSINTAVATEADGHRITINTADANPLRIDGAVTTINPSDGPLALGSSSLFFSGSTYTLEYGNGEQLIVRDGGRSLNIHYCASNDRDPGSLQGLLGNFDGIASNDLRLADGTTFSTNISFNDLYGPFEDGWRITQDESLFDYDPGEDTETFTNRDAPWHKTSIDLLPDDKVAQANALLDAAGVTDPVLRDAAILDFASSMDPWFIESVTSIGQPTDSAEIIDPLIIWQNGGQVLIGTNTAPENFNIGTIAATPAGVTWAGLTVSDEWSQVGNWSPVGLPTSIDTVVFDGTDIGNVNVIDQDFDIGGLFYTATGDYVTDLNGGSILQVNGDATVSVVGPTNRATLVVQEGTEVIANSNEINVGLMASGLGTVTGGLVIDQHAMLDGSDVGSLNIGRETGAATFQSTAGKGSLTLGNSSSIHLGSAAAPGTLNIGWSQNGNSSASGSATGVFDALDKAAVLDLNLSELNVGRGSAYGVGNGTLKWDQTEVIAASNVNFGRGRGTGVLETPAGGEFYLGSSTDPIDNLRIALNDAGRGTATANLDFSVTNPTFVAHIANDLSIGRETGTSTFQSTATNGSLILGSNSSIHLGSAAAPGTLNIGLSQNGNSSSTGGASGVLDTTAGVFNAELNALRVGQTGNRGTATGEFTVGSGVQLDTPTTNIGVGSGATGQLAFVDDFTGSYTSGTVNLQRGLLDFGNNTLTVDSSGNILVTTFNLAGGTLRGDTVDFDGTTGTFNFTSGTLAVDGFNGTLAQLGGTLTPGNSSGITTVNGDYNLSSAGTIEIDLNGAGTGGMDFDQVQVNGGVNINANVGSGAILSVVLGYTPTVGHGFTIIDNDASDLIVGFFNGLPQLGTFDVVNGADTVTFQIDYAGGNGNDVDLVVTEVTTAPVAPIAASSAAGTGAPATLGASPLVELVPDEDVLVFDNDASGPSPTAATATVGSLAPATLDMIAGSGRIGTDGVKGDEVDTVVDSGVLDDMDLIGLPSDGGLSHDLYV